jgi:hypothetical protein
MRRSLAMLAFLPAMALAMPARADTIVLKDGRSLQSAGPYVVKGRQALLKQPDGTLVSIPFSEIDVEKTALARQKLQTPSPASTPALSKPLTPAEAAKQKSSRKALLVLTDDEVAQSVGSAEGEKQEEGPERVDISNTSATKVKGGYAITGSVINSGKADASGVSVTIEAIGENNKTVASAFGNLAKDRLSPGEKSTFTANISTDKDASNFRYVPRWQVKMGVKSGGGAGPGGGGETSTEANATPAAAPNQAGEKGEKEKAAPEPARTPVGRPDVAWPVSNAPVGAPEKPGGTYLPKPTGDQPKTPGGS